MKITNPVLTGFHADPSMIRVKDTYYIANSTFEWFPGIRLHESKDMVHWNTLPYPLGVEQLDMRGDPASGGVWAPDLSYADGRFWIVYSDVHIVNGAFKDVVNYLTTAEDIRGPWSKPLRLNGVGFDASLFHDDGTPVDETVLHPVGFIAATAEGSLAAMHSQEPDALDNAIRWVRLLWDTPIRTGTRRYYDNFLYAFAFLALAGEYRTW